MVLLCTDLLLYSFRDSTGKQEEDLAIICASALLEIFYAHQMKNGGLTGCRYFKIGFKSLKSIGSYINACMLSICESCYHHRSLLLSP